MRRRGGLLGVQYELDIGVSELMPSRPAPPEHAPGEADPPGPDPSTLPPK